MHRPLSLSLAIALVFLSLPAIADHPERGPRNFDVRDDSSKDSAAVLEKHLRRKGADQKGKKAEVQNEMKKAEKRLAGEIGDLEVQLSPRTGGPELVRGKGKKKLTPASSNHREQTLRKFLRENADLYGLEQRDIAKLEVLADYANPAGNMSWLIVAPRVKGKSIFRGELQAAFTAAGELVQVGGEIPAAIDEAEAVEAPLVAVTDAVVKAAASIGIDVSASELQVTQNGNAYSISGGPFSDDSKAELIYFPLDVGALELSWSLTLITPSDGYAMVVSAEEADVLYRKNLVSDQTLPATYSYYNADSPAPLSPTTALPGTNTQASLIMRELLTTITELPGDPWLPDGANTTTGNNVDAGLDIASPDGIDPAGRPTGSPFRIFDFAYNPGPGSPAPGDSPTLTGYRNGEVTHMFVWTNRYHDRLYQLGFTEAARNFQLNNYGRGGLQNDRVLAQGQDFSGTDNANFLTPSDGTSGRMQMYIFTGPTPDRTSGLDQDILLHELTHGTSNRLHNNGNGLNNTMSGGMGEGWSDFYARCLLSGPDEDPNGIYAAGGYATQFIVAGFTDNYYYGIRRFPYASRSTVGANGRPHNPLTFADIDGSQINLTDGAYPRGPIGSSTAFAVHNIGEVWASALFEVRARIIARLGREPGNQRTLQIVTDGMKLDPVNPTLLDGRNSILTADCAGFGGADEMEIWQGFAERGMGFSAVAASSASSAVTEAFDVPNLVLGAMTITGGTCDPDDGYADPGETVTLNFPVTNPFCAATANGTSLSVAGGGSVSLGSIAPGQTVNASVSYTVPAGSCGTILTPLVTLTSSLGNVNRPLSIEVGFPLAGPTSTFSTGNTNTPLPDVATVNVPIVISDAGVVHDVNVKVRLNHTFDGDLEVRLIHPDGTVVMLSDNRGGTGDNFGTGSNDCAGTFTVFDDSAATAIASGTAPYAGSFRPEQALAALNGKAMNGTWTLRITDTANVDVGTLYCAQLEVTRAIHYCCGVPGTPVIAAVPPPVVVAESAAPANNAPDANETVTMTFALRNNGSGATTNLVATLLPGGGVLSPGAPQSYGVLTPTGPAGSRPFTFVVDGTCGGNITATFSLQDGASSLGTVSFTIRVGGIATTVTPGANTTSITIPNSGTATPYPSTINVSGVSGTVNKVTATIHGFTHTFPGDVDVLLAGPTGRTVVLLSDIGGTNDVVNVTLTFDDNGPIPGATLVTGTIRPTNSGTGDAFPAPAPPLPHGTVLSTFNGENPNGAWRLFVVDDAGGDLGSFGGGWSLSLTTADPFCVDQPCTLSCSNVTASTAPGQPGNTVTFSSGLSGSCGVLSYAPPSGSFFSIGNTTVTTTATRNDGGTSSCTFVVTVNDVEPPVITGLSATPSIIDSNNHKMVNVTVDYTSTDNGGVPNTCAITVTSNEPVNGTGDGDTGPDWEIVDAHHVRLRAERAGTAPGRIYTITVTCIDAAGNPTSASTQVLVPHDNRP